MALVATVTDALSLGDTKKLYYGTLAFDDSYPTGGEALDLSNNESLDIVIAQGYGYNYRWDRAAQKLLVYHGDNDNAGDGPGVQVPNATDISAIAAASFFAIGS